MNFLGYIIWTFDPALFSLSFTDYAPRWYGVLFALGFIISQQVLFWMFRSEGKPEKDVEKLTTYMVVATIVGARLGHCLFYDPAYYLSNPIEILKVWEGGLASHGGLLGILVTIYLFCKKYKYQYLWILDRMVIVSALTGALIRTGNLANSEMEGTLTHSNFGIVYARATHDVLNYDKEKVESVDFSKGGQMTSDVSGIVPITASIEYKRGFDFGVDEKLFLESVVRRSLLRYNRVIQHVSLGEEPLKYNSYQRDGRWYVDIYMLGKVRHAGQMYEAIYCLLLTIVLLWLWYKRRDVLPQGFNFSLFMIILWSARFIDEFFKMNQEKFEDDLVLNMGQILSMPLTIVGIVTMIWVYRRGKKMSDKE